MMAKEKNTSFPAVGGSSLLAIFAVLCMVVFALLSITTVQAEKRLADASAEAVEAYYAADRAAEQIYTRLRLGETVEGVQIDGDIYRYSCPISEHQVLEVELRKGEEWEVLRWQAVATPETVEDSDLNLWEG